MNRMAKTLIRLIRDTLGDVDEIFGAEIGVWEGKTSEMLLREFPILILFMVDRYKLYEPGGTGTLSKVKTQDEMYEAMGKAVDRTMFAESRRILLIGDSTDVREIIPKGLDFIFFDADHSYTAVYRDLGSYYPKVTRGGLVCGHDYGGRFGVKRAVDEFAEERGITVYVAPQRIWWFVKQ